MKLSLCTQGYSLCGSLIITEQPEPYHSLRQESEGISSVFPCYNIVYILENYSRCIYLLSIFPPFFFLSRKKSVREEPSVLLLNKGGNNEKPSLPGHILHWMYPWYWKCMSVADNCPLFRSSSSLGHEERPLKFVASVHSLLICSQHNYFLVHLFFTEYFFKILLIKKSGLQGPVGILSFPQHFH